MDQERIEDVLRRTTLRQVEVVLAVHEYGTMTKAAGALGMSVANVSRTTQRFEDNLGIRIFKGEGRRRALTVASGEIFASFKPLLSEIERLRTALANFVPD